MADQQQPVDIQRMNALAGNIAEAGGEPPFIQQFDPSERSEELAISVIAAGDIEFESGLRANMKKFKDALLGRAPTPVEEVMTDLLVGSWLQRQYLQRNFWTLIAGDLGSLITVPGGEKLLAMWIKILDVPLARLNQSLRVLSLLRQQAGQLIGPDGVAQPGQRLEVEKAKAQAAVEQADQTSAAQKPIAPPQAIDTSGDSSVLPPPHA